MNRVFLICFLMLSLYSVSGQSDTASRNGPAAKTTAVQPQVTTTPKPKQAKPIDTLAKPSVDSSVLKDSLARLVFLQDSLRNDSLKKAALAKIPIVVYDTSTYRKYETHPWLPLHKPGIYMIIDYRKAQSKDELFYLIAGVIFMLAFIKTAFPKYFKNLFLLFFQTSLRQKQTRDQLLQDNLASLLTNLLFIITASLYITLLVEYRHWVQYAFWWLAAGSALLLLLTYLVKYLFLLFAGWVFNTKEATSSYTFVVFMVNKVLGVILVPFLLVLAFAANTIIEVSVTLSAGLLILLVAYRYWVSFTAIQHKLKVNALHFLLYLCAVELLPLVLIYKVLINYLAGSF